MKYLLIFTPDAIISCQMHFEADTSLWSILKDYTLNKLFKNIQMPEPGHVEENGTIK